MAKTPAHIDVRELPLPPYLQAFLQEWDTAQIVADLLWGSVVIEQKDSKGEVTWTFEIDAKILTTLLLFSAQAQDAINSHHLVKKSVDRADKIPTKKSTSEKKKKRRDLLKRFYGCKETETKYLDVSHQLDRVPSRYMFIALVEFLEKYWDNKVNKKYGSSKSEKNINVKIGEKNMERLHAKKGLEYYLQYEGVWFYFSFKYDIYNKRIHFDFENGIMYDGTDKSWEIIRKLLDELRDRTYELLSEDIRWKVIWVDFKERTLDPKKEQTELFLDDKTYDSIFWPYKLFLDPDNNTVVWRTVVFKWKPGLWKTLASTKMVQEKSPETTVIIASANDNDFNLKELLEIARRCKPCLIILDDAEHLISNNQSWWRSHWAREMIAELDSFTDNEGIFMVITTNFPDNIDDALKRPGRIQDFINFWYPNQNIREQYFETWSKKNNELNIESRKNEIIELSDWCTLDEFEWALNEMKIFIASGKSLGDWFEKFKEYIWRFNWKEGKWVI